MWTATLVPQALNPANRELLQKIIGESGYIWGGFGLDVGFPHLEFLCDDAPFKRMVEAGFGELVRSPSYQHSDQEGLPRDIDGVDAYLLVPTESPTLFKPVIAEFGDIAHETRSISPQSDIILGRQPEDHVAVVEGELLFSVALVGFFVAYDISFCSGKVLDDRKNKVLPYKRVEKKNALDVLASSSFATLNCPICGEGFKHFRFPLFSENFEMEDLDFCGFSKAFEGHEADVEGIRKFVVSASVAESLRARFRRNQLELLPFTRESSSKGRKLVEFEEMLLSVGFSW